MTDWTQEAIDRRLQDRTGNAAHVLLPDDAVGKLAMIYCSNCGASVPEGGKFCSSCGAAASSVRNEGVPVTQTSVGPAAPVMQPARVVVVAPKRGGWLAVKGFVTAFILAVVLVAATHDNTSTRALGMILAFGSGVAYIVINMRQWKRNNEVIRGAGISWTVVALLLLFCLVNLPNVFGGGDKETSASVVNSTISSPAPVPPPDPKETLLRDVKLDFKWHKDGFGNIMIADFTLRNPTQYRFKDFEIKCTHSAPSGTVIDSNTRTIYETVESRSTKVVKGMNMGFINSQASRSGCEISDLVPLQ
jgi:hypothetical protein